MVVENRVYHKVMSLTLLSVLAAFFTYQVDAWVGKNLGAVVYGDFKVVVRVFHLVGHIGLLGQDTMMIMQASQYNKKKEWALFRGLFVWIQRTYTWRMLAFYGVLLAVKCVYDFNPKFFYHLLNSLDHPGFSHSMIFILSAVPFLVAATLFEKFFIFRRFFYLALAPKSFFLPLIYLFYAYIFSIDWNLETAVHLYGYAFITIALFDAVVYWRLKLPTNKSHVIKSKSWWHISLQFYSTSLLVTSGRSVTLFLLEFLGVDEAAVGYFAAISAIIAIFHLIVKPVESFLRPYISQLLQDEPKDFRHILARCNVIRYGLCSVLYAIILLSPSFILSFYGKTFLPAVKPLLFAATCFYIYTLGQPNIDLLSYAGYQKDSMQCVWGQLICSVFLAVVLIPKIGIWGAVLADGLTMILLVVLAGIIAKKRLGRQAWFVLK